MFLKISLCVFIALIVNCNLVWSLSNIRKEVDFKVQNNDSLPDEYFVEILERYPDDEFIQAIRVYSLAYLGEIEKADSLIKIYTNAQSRSTYLLMVNALIEELKGNYDSAEAFYYLSKSYDVDSSNKWLMLELFHFYEEENFDLASQYLDKALSIDSNFTQALMYRALTLDDVYDCEITIELLNRVIENYSNVHVYSDLATTYLNCIDATEQNFRTMSLRTLNYIGKARKLYLKSNKYANNFNANYGLAHISHRYYNNYDSAFYYYKKALELDSTNSLLLTGIAQAYYDVGNNDLAEEYFLKSVQLDSSFSAYKSYIKFKINVLDFTGAGNLIDIFEEAYGKSYMTDGFRVMLIILNNDEDNGVEVSNLLKEFENKYSYTKYKWLMDTYASLDVHPDFEEAFPLE
jgi:tetratricopeptide (TPR) repeat protein